MFGIVDKTLNDVRNADLESHADDRPRRVLAHAAQYRRNVSGEFPLARHYVPERFAYQNVPAQFWRGGNRSQH